MIKLLPGDLKTRLIITATLTTMSTPASTFARVSTSTSITLLYEDMTLPPWLLSRGVQLRVSAGEHVFPTSPRRLYVFISQGYPWHRQCRGMSAGLGVGSVCFYLVETTSCIVTDLGPFSGRYPKRSRSRSEGSVELRQVSMSPAHVQHGQLGMPSAQGDMHSHMRASAHSA